MSERATDELAGGSARDPLRAPGWLRVTALLAVACLAAWALLARHDPAPPGATLGAPVRPGVVPAQRSVVLGSQPGLLGVHAMCVRTGRDHAVWLGVDLVNGRLARTTLLAVTRVARPGESTQGDATLPARRTCNGQPVKRDSLVMRPGGIVPMRIGLRQQDLCGARPVSVQVDVSFLGPGEQPAAQRLDLHPAELDVAVCPSR